MALTLKKGDPVVVLAFEDLGVTTEGVVVAITSDPEKQIGVEFPDPVGKHHCDGRGEHGHCLWVRAEHVRHPGHHAELEKARQARLASRVVHRELDSIEIAGPAPASDVERN